MLEEILAGGAAALGISLSGDALKLYRAYYEELTAANRVLNLTAVSGEDEAATLHFLDSLAALTCVCFRGKTVVDVGAGGGLPGLALKIAEPAMDLTLLDATEKKVAFLASLTRKLGVPCDCVCGRAEELSCEAPYRERYDVAVARAVAELRILAELCLPLVRVGGNFAAYKSAGGDAEIDAAKSTIEALGGEIAAVNRITLPGTDVSRRIVVVRKTAPTPERFPRRWAAMVKRAVEAG